MSAIEIPALSIRQPWAELIVRGRKSIEIRMWSSDYRGKIWIHTGRRADPLLEERMGFHELFKGGYIGLANVEMIVPLDPSRWEAWRDRHLDGGRFKLGMYAWILSKPIRLKQPVPAPGELMLYYPDPDVLASLQEALGQVTE